MLWLPRNSFEPDYARYNPPFAMPMNANSDRHTAPGHDALLGSRTWKILGCAADVSSTVTCICDAFAAQLGNVSFLWRSAFDQNVGL